MASTATANENGRRYVLASCCVLKGSRATITTPTNGNVVQSPGSAFIGSVLASDDTGANGIQDGFARVDDDTIDQSGSACSSTDIALIYFTEVINSGVFDCYNQGTASYQTAHKFSVQRASTGVWYAYNDGVCTKLSGTCISTTWSADGGNAAEIDAYGESTTSTGKRAWQVSFGGTVPWQRYDTSGVWDTIGTAPSLYDGFWFETGTFNTTWAINLNAPG